MSGSLQLSVNGAAVEAPAGSTLGDLLRQLQLDRKRVAVEHNRRVVPRAEHEGVRLSHGDEIEIVTFVGGGSCPGPDVRELRDGRTGEQHSPVRGTYVV